MSSSSSNDWQLTRLRRKTVSDLLALVAGLIRGAENGRNHYYDMEDTWTADKVLRILIDRENRKRQRSSRTRTKPRNRKNGEKPAAIPTLEDFAGNGDERDEERGF